MLVDMLIRHRGAEPVVHPTAYVAPNATLVGRVEVGPRARIMYGAGANIAVGALVHANTVVPPEHFVPPHTLAVGDPMPVVTTDRMPEVADAIRSADFTRTAFGVRAQWDDRLERYEKAAEARSSEFAAHSEDEVIG